MQALIFISMGVREDLDVYNFFFVQQKVNFLDLNKHSRENRIMVKIVKLKWDLLAEMSNSSCGLPEALSPECRYFNSSGRDLSIKS